MATRSTLEGVFPTKNKTSDSKPEFAGDYLLQYIILHGHSGEKIDIKNIVQELNVYESIYRHAVTGTVVIGDTQNQIARMKIQGLERIEFKLIRPGYKDSIDASVKTGEPFEVYKITNRKMVTPTLMVYTLHFASREFMRNIRTKVSQAYSGRYDLAVLDILSDKDYLDSRKKLFYEPTANQDKIVVPNVRPFDAIQTIASKAMPNNSGGVGYYFYETTKGFNFRSWDSMVARAGAFARRPKQQFYYQPLKLSNERETDKVQEGYQTIESFEFINNIHDVAANVALGTYGHRVLTHNLYSKSFDKKDYHYHNEFNDSLHTDSFFKLDEFTGADAGFATNTKKSDNFAVAETPVDYDNEDSISDYPESRVSVQSTTQYLHGEISGMYGIDVDNDGSKTGEYISQQNQVQHGTALKMTVKGQPGISAGDLVVINLKDPNADRDKNPAEGLLNDPRFSGNYVVTKVRHQVTGDIYKMVLECVKDSVSTYNGKGRSVRETSKVFTPQVIDSSDPYGSI